MSNSLVGNSWHIDTGSSTALSTLFGVLQAIHWDNGTAGAADDHLEITDGAGNTIFHAHASAKDYQVSLTFPKGLKIRGIIVPTISHGAVCLHWDRQPGT